jgi:signal transduction histidine kinase
VTGADDVRRGSLPVDLDRLLHDLRGPLNAVVMHLEVLKRLGADDGMARSSLLTVQQELERLTAMLPAAFSIAALERGPARPVLLRAVVESALDEAARKRVTIAPSPWPEIAGDERLLVLAVRHLVANALEASGEDGPVRIGAETPDAGRVTIVVRDSGPGFKTRNPNAIARLMATTKRGHAGIGLMIVQRVARLHGGTVAFETAPEGGGLVRLTLATGA